MKNYLMAIFTLAILAAFGLVHASPDKADTDTGLRGTAAEPNLPPAALEDQIKNLVQQLRRDPFDAATIQTLKRLRTRQQQQRYLTLHHLAQGLQAFIDRQPVSALHLLEKARQRPLADELADKFLVIALSEIVVACRLDAQQPPCPYCGDTRQLDCPQCHGLGWRRCSPCRGRGQIMRRRDRYEAFSLTCNQCNATGRVICPSCSGDGTIACPHCANDVTASDALLSPRLIQQVRECILSIRAILWIQPLIPDHMPPAASSADPSPPT